MNSQVNNDFEEWWANKMIVYKDSDVMKENVGFWKEQCRSAHQRGFKYGDAR